MSYQIDNVIDLDDLRESHGYNVPLIRLELEARGLEWMEANQFAIFAVYGFSDPRGQPTLDTFQLGRLSLRTRFTCEETGAPLLCLPMNHTPGRPLLN